MRGTRTSEAPHACPKRGWDAFPFLLLLLAVVVIAAATFVEASYGTAVAHERIYNSVAFKLLWAAIAVSGCVLLWKRRLWHRWTVLLIHLGFLIILAGALLTNLMGKKGMLHLREGIPASRFVSDGRMEELPFLVRLDSFNICYYPGTEAPQDYVSTVTIDGQQHRISMNRIARLKSYRLYQTSYDEDGHGTVLSVNYDPWGIAVTYTGYGLLALGFLLSLGAKRYGKRLLALLFPLLCFSFSAWASLPVVNAEKARELAREQVMWNDRPCPVGVMSQDFLLKIYGRRKYHGLDAAQVVASWILSPDAWNDEPIIKLKRGEYAKMNDFIDRTGDVPRLKNIGRDAKTDEKIALILMLQQGTLVQPLPADVERLSETKVDVELLYARIDWTMIGMQACFVLALFSYFVSSPRKKNFQLFTLNSQLSNQLCRSARLSNRLCRSARLRTLNFQLSTLHFLLFLFLLAAFLLRWYIGGHIPLGNGYETMLFVALCLLAAGLSPALQRRTGGAAVALLMAAFVLLVAHLGESDPRITPLMPVLHSPWLSAHVSVIMMSYALLTLSIVERRLLQLGVSLLAVGIFLGAVWANVSWGTYWSWDPKESWALITLIIYSLPLHQESLPWFRSLRNYRLYSLLGLASLLMTYFGVNLLLGGMHSYK